MRGPYLEQMSSHSTAEVLDDRSPCLKEVRNWTRPIAAVAVLMNWSTILALEHSTLHEALMRLYALPFPH